MRFRLVSLLSGAGLLGVVLFVLGCRQSDAPAIIPAPLALEPHPGHFTLLPGSKIIVAPAARETGQYLADKLRPSTGFTIPLANSPLEPHAGDIQLTTQSATPALGAEGYELVVTTTSVVIRAPTDAGLFYGVQSLLQLFPAAVFASRPPAHANWRIPCLQIQDQPRFAWRGFMLDVSRHFFSKTEVECLLDLMAIHKLNHFHWHLTDDQGWRLQIKKYPRLTEVGAWRNQIGFHLDPKASTAYGPDGRYGGFYTQADVREIVAYAAARHIIVIPEIEMPGHANAALAAYPELSCFGGPYSTDTSRSRSAGVYCAGQEATFRFLEDVLSEVIDLFPSKYIHIGGDEVNKQNWRDCPRCQARMRTENLKTEHDLQTYFVNRIEKFLAAHGRILMGWTEINQDNLAPGSTIMDWLDDGAAAAAAGHDVVMTPSPFCYLDYYQARDRTAEPPAIGAFLPLQKVYSFEPIPASLKPQDQPHILGAQANLWTEFIPSLNQAEYMAFPRLCALAEVAWSSRASRDWASFQQRLQHHLPRLKEMGVNYRPVRAGE